MLRNLAFAILVAVLGQHGPLLHQTSDEPLWPAFHLTITDLPSGPDAPLLHLRRVWDGTPAHFTVDDRGNVAEDFGGLQMDFLSTFPEIKRTGSLALADDGAVHNLTSDSSLLISVRPKPTSDDCKAALWAVLRGLIDTLSDHPQVATAPLLRWAADQCEDQP